MKKIMFGAILLVGVLLTFGTIIFAADTPFTVSVNVPPATGVQIDAYKVIGTSWTDVTTGIFNFDDLYYDGSYEIWRSPQYFAIDVLPTGGGGNPDISVTYSEVDAPSGQVKGLGYKATCKFVKKVGTTETDLKEKLLIDLVGAVGDINEVDVAGGNLRLYVGLYDGANTVLNNDGGEPFSNADLDGYYEGTLTVTTTL